MVDSYADRHATLSQADQKILDLRFKHFLINYLSEPIHPDTISLPY